MRRLLTRQQEPYETVDLRDTIRYLRAESGMTQVEFAERLGVNVETLRAWEAGESLRGIAIFLNAAKRLGFELFANSG